jgi:hypothetical protein
VQVASLLGALKPAELKSLRGTRRRLMVVPPGLHQYERVSEQLPECRCVMADDW